MSGMAEVLAAHRVSSVRVASHAGLDHMPDIGVYEQRCQTCGKIDGAQSDHQAAMLTAAGFGPVKEAGAVALEEAADDTTLRLSGHSGISITKLRARAAAIRTASA